MAIPKAELLRLLRERWANPTILSEEIYAILAGDVPETLNGPVTINNPTGGPAIVVNQLGGSDQLLQVQRAPAQPFDFPPLPGVPGSGLPDLPQFPGLPPLPAQPEIPPLGDGQPLPRRPDQPDIPPTGPGLTVVGVLGNDPSGDVPPRGEPGGPAPLSGGGNVSLGRVVSGSGDTYVVDLYGAGSGMPATARVVATVPQIDPAAVIPEGTWLAAVHAFIPDGLTGVVTHEFQPPVWL